VVLKNPEIVAQERQNELQNIMTGLTTSGSAVEHIDQPIMLDRIRWISSKIPLKDKVIISSIAIAGTLWKVFLAIWSAIIFIIFDNYVTGKIWKTCQRLGRDILPRCQKIPLVSLHGCQKSHRIRKPDMFSSIHLEINTDCNRACHYCSNFIYPKKTEYMFPQLYRKLLMSLMTKIQGSSLF